MIWTKYHLELALFWSADLRSANLSGANLSGANLWSANLRSANLSGANLSGANLSGANLRSANLWSADLRSANLSGANLRSADLSGANLRSADLRSADLRSADLSGATLLGANLSGANLRSANLRGANSDKRLLQHSIVPEKGAFIGFKKLQNGIIAELEIPKNAKRSGGIVGRKCRAEFVKVIRLSRGKVGYGIRQANFAYPIGKIVRADGWDKNPAIECTSGIHFFLTRQEAEDFIL